MNIFYRINDWWNTQVPHPFDYPNKAAMRENRKRVKKMYREHPISEEDHEWTRQSLIMLGVDPDVFKDKRKWYW